MRGPVDSASVLACMLGAATSSQPDMEGPSLHTLAVLMQVVKSWRAVDAWLT
jgi:hypothetical protein